jgi:hypothetical protein
VLQVVKQQKPNPLIKCTYTTMNIVLVRLAWTEIMCPLKMEFHFI